MRTTNAPETKVARKNAEKGHSAHVVDLDTPMSFNPEEAAHEGRVASVSVPLAEAVGSKQCDATDQNRRRRH